MGWMMGRHPLSCVIRWALGGCSASSHTDAPPGLVLGAETPARRPLRLSRAGEESLTLDGGRGKVAVTNPVRGVQEGAYERTRALSKCHLFSPCLLTWESALMRETYDTETPKDTLSPPDSLVLARYPTPGNSLLNGDHSDLLHQDAVRIK